MKKVLLTFSSVLFLAATVHAQKWSAGYRTGMELDNTRFNNNPIDNENLLWNNQLFLNRKIIGNLEAEVTATYNYKESNYIITDLWDGPELIKVRNRVSTLTMGLYLRYNLYQKNNWRFFAQAGMGSYKSWNCYDGETLQTINSTPAPFSGKESPRMVLAHTLEGGLGTSYSIGKRFYLNSILNVGYKTDGSSRLSEPTTDFATSLFVGVGFRF
jgi:hypothetical protein